MGHFTKNDFAYGFQIIAILILFSYSPILSKDKFQGISLLKKQTVRHIKSVPGVNTNGNNYPTINGHLIARHFGQQQKKEDAINLPQYSQPDFSNIIQPYNKKWIY